MANQQINNREPTDLKHSIRELEEKNEELEAQQEELQAVVEALIDKNNRLNTAMQELTERNFEMDQLIYRTSHDLRSPISSILGILNLLNMEKEQPFTDYLGHIQSKTNQLDTTVQSLVNFVKSTREEIKTEDINLKELVQTNVDQLEFIPNYDKLQILIKDNFKGAFYSDYSKLAILVRCLLSNAIQFQGANQENYLEITISGSQENAQIEFFDNGQGIAKSVLPKVTEMFFRGNIDSKGAGMGLYIADKIVKKLNGTLKIDSKEGYWTNVIIKIDNKPQPPTTIKKIPAD